MARGGAINGLGRKAGAGGPDGKTEGNLEEDDESQKKRAGVAESSRGCPTSLPVTALKKPTPGRVRLIKPAL